MRVTVRLRVGVGVGVRARSHLNLVVSLRRGTDVSEPADVGTDLRLLPMGHGHVHLRRILLLNGRTRGNSAALEATALVARGNGWAPNRRGRPVPGTAAPARAMLRRHGNRGWRRGTLTMLSRLARTRDLEPGVVDLDRPVRREGPDPVDRGQAQADRACYQGSGCGRLARGVGRVEGLHGG